MVPAFRAKSEKCSSQLPRRHPNCRKRGPTSSIHERSRTCPQIRRAVVTDKSLSIRAHNIKIITKNGTVTLRGAVRSDQEKNAVTAKAIEFAGANNVKDEISVKRKG